MEIIRSEMMPVPPEEVAYQLELLRRDLQRGAYPRYPASRLVMPYFALDRAAGRIVLPDGPWAVDPNMGRGDSGLAPDLAAQWEWAARGLELDATGNPLHPWLRVMIEDPMLGVVTNKGYYHERGPNHTDDAVVCWNDKLLLVKRGDTGLWALPGGHQNKGEGADAGARRETWEETRVAIPNEVGGEIVYAGPVVDPRMTAHAWPETTALRYRLDGSKPLPRPRARDDADEADWFTREEIRALPLFGAHRFLIAKAPRENQGASESLLVYHALGH